MMDASTEFLEMLPAQFLFLLSFLCAERGGEEKSSSLSGKRTLPRFRILTDTSHSCRVSNWTDKQECYYFRHQKFKIFPQQTILIMQKKRERWFFEILRLFRLLPTVDRGKEYRNLWVLERCSGVLKSQLPSEWSSLNQSQLSKPTLTVRNENAKLLFRCSRFVCNIGYFFSQ